MNSTSRTALPGLGLALVSAAAFAFSGTFAKSLFESGWSSGAAVLARIGGAAVVLSAIGGLVLVLDLSGNQSIDVVGVLWGLAAAVCSAFYFVMSARADDSVPPVLMAGGGMVFGAGLIGILGLTGLMPLAMNTSDVVFSGQQVSWLVPLLGLVLLSTVFSYVFGIMGVRRLGTRVASFVSLMEVLFAVLWAWLLLAELPGVVQLFGGLLIVLGVVLVRVDELRQPGPGGHSAESETLAEWTSEAWPLPAEGLPLEAPQPQRVGHHQD